MEDQDLGEIHCRNTGHVFNLVKIKWQICTVCPGSQIEKENG